MFYNKEISILGDDGYLDENALWVDGTLSVLKTIECDVQPYNKELAYRDYSFEEDVKYRVFCEPDKLIKNGVQVSYLEDFHEEETIFSIVKVISWDSYWVVLIDV